MGRGFRLNFNYDRFDARTDVRFLLYTRKNEREPEHILLEDKECLLNSSFDPEHPIRFLIHGFNDGHCAILNRDGKAAYLRKGHFNVIIVDWGKGANTGINYPLAKARAYRVASVIARFVDFLVATFEDASLLARTYIIGHSLGSHIAGVAGKQIQAGKIAAIYGLDPAGPLFTQLPADQRLDRGDAEYVEVIHTDCHYQGLPAPIGHTDFYLNRGTIQPGVGFDIFIGSHMRAVTYFTESINSECGFWGRPCRSYGEMKKNRFMAEEECQRMAGEPALSGREGIFSVRTAPCAPFALGPRKGHIKLVKEELEHKDEEAKEAAEKEKVE